MGRQQDYDGPHEIEKSFQKMTHYENETPSEAAGRMAARLQGPATRIRGRGGNHRHPGGKPSIV
jgi:hypothetical protein